MVGLAVRGSNPGRKFQEIFTLLQNGQSNSGALKAYPCNFPWNKAIG